jgi:hypothetical protein
VVVLDEQADHELGQVTLLDARQASPRRLEGRHFNPGTPLATAKNPPTEFVTQLESYTMGELLGAAGDAARRATGKSTTS